MVTQLLDDEDRQTIDNALQTVDALRSEIQRAKSAGIDLGDLEDRLETAVQKVTAIRSSFFA